MKTKMKRSLLLVPVIFILLPAMLLPACTQDFQPAREAMEILTQSDRNLYAYLSGGTLYVTPDLEEESGLPVYCPQDAEGRDMADFWVDFDGDGSFLYLYDPGACDQKGGFFRFRYGEFEDCPGADWRDYTDVIAEGMKPLQETLFCLRDGEAVFGVPQEGIFWYDGRQTTGISAQNSDFFVLEDRFILFSEQTQSGVKQFFCADLEESGQRSLIAEDILEQYGNMYLAQGPEGTTLYILKNAEKPEKIADNAKIVIARGSRVFYTTINSAFDRLVYNLYSYDQLDDTEYILGDKVVSMECIGNFILYRTLGESLDEENEEDWREYVACLEKPVAISVSDEDWETCQTLLRREDGKDGEFCMDVSESAVCFHVEGGVLYVFDRKGDILGGYEKISDCVEDFLILDDSSVLYIAENALYRYNGGENRAVREKIDSVWCQKVWTVK